MKTREGLTHWSHAKGEARLAVERVLQEAAEALTCEEVAQLAGMRYATARAHMTNIVAHRLAHNLTPNRRDSKYRWGPPPVVTLPVTAGPRYVPPKGSYTGSELTQPPAREAGMHAYTIASVENGNRIEARRPMLIGSNATSQGRNVGFRD